MAERKRFLLRMSPELYEELNRWAAQEFRSVNGQIEYVLKRAVEERNKGVARSVPTEERRGPEVP